jgi:hypothetical protein
MTLAVAIKAADAIIVAADSRGTIGDPRGLTAVNDTQQKVFQFGQCALAIAGSSEIALALLDEFARAGIDNPQDIDTAVRTFAQGAIYCDNWFRNIPPEQRPGTIFLLGGYRNTGGSHVPMVYLLTSNTHFAPQLAGNYPMMAGVPQYAIYLSHRYYDPSMTGESAAALAEYLISETASQDPKVGGPIRIAKVTPQKGYYSLTDGEVASLKRKNEAINAKLKRFFAQRGKP